jgi:hypothetical protein
MARQQFVGVVHEDPDISHHPLLHRIGNALQSSQVRMAQLLAHELRDEGLSAWNDSMHARAGATSASSLTSRPRHSASPSSWVNATAHRVSSSQHIIDLRA